MDFMIWKAVELPLSIIVGCLPTLRPLIAKVKEITQGQSRRNGYQVHPDSNNRMNRLGKGKPKSNGTASSTEDSRLYQGQNSIMKETTWVVEEEV